LALEATRTRAQTGKKKKKNSPSTSTTSLTTPQKKTSVASTAAAPAASAPPPRVAGKALVGVSRKRGSALGGKNATTKTFLIPAAAAPPTSAFDIPAAPILIPAGPWTVIEGGVCAAKGFLANGMAGGLRASGPKADLALVAVDPSLPPAAAAGVFTKNVMCAAPVTFCRRALASTPTARAVLINAGQANAATGDLGYADCERSAAELKKALGASSDKGESLLLLSTGVIGRRIKMEPLVQSLPVLVKGLGATAEDALHAAVAVTTTDLVSKSAALEVRRKKEKTLSFGSFFVYSTSARVEPKTF
jgi:glutamate N-acetyltransferase / amino-acid N-acetyltransferase